jgi:hypothetical protein
MAYTGRSGQSKHFVRVSFMPMPSRGLLGGKSDKATQSATKPKKTRSKESMIKSGVLAYRSRPGGGSGGPASTPT